MGVSEIRKELLLSVRQGPFIFSAIVVVSCLTVGIALAAFFENVPAVVISVVLACAVATLIHAFLGGVSEAGFNLGVLKVTGSGAVLLGSVWFINSALDPQLDQIRYDSRVERFGFDFDEHAAPAGGWFAINESTGVPVDVEFTDPVTGEVVETVTRPTAASLLLKLAREEENGRYVVLGTSAETEQGLGYVSASDLIDAVRSSGFRPETIYGVQRLYLAKDGELPQEMDQRWGNTECRGLSMPFQIEVVRFNGFADYDLRRCDAEAGAPPDHSSSLRSGEGELVLLTILGQQRSFVIAVVGADHRSNTPWSAFLAIEMGAGT